MISNWVSHWSDSISRSRSLAFKGSLEMSKWLPDAPLRIIGEYLLAGDWQNLTCLCGRMKHLAFDSSSEGGEPVWTSLYRRDCTSSMAIAEQLLPQQATRFRDLSRTRTDRSSLHALPSSRRFSALRVQALAALGQYSTWPATRADVLAHLYPARLSVRTYDFQQMLQGHTYPVEDIIQLADGRLASASIDGTIRIWPLNRGAPLVLVGHNGSVSRIIQLVDGCIASVSHDHTIRIWPLNGGAPLVLAGHNGWVCHIIQLVDGRIASASDDHTMRIWPLNGGAPLVLVGHNGSVSHLIQLVDGRIASASDDHTMRIWSLNGSASRVLAGHNHSVYHIIQLADGCIASASVDQTIRIWGPNTNQLVRTATRQARYRKATHKVSRKAILALGFVLLAWGMNALLKTIARGFTHTT